MSGSAAEILGPAGARRDLEAVGPAEETGMQRRHRREVHRGHRLSAQKRLVRTASPKTGAPLLLPFELRYALRPLQRVRPERSFREEILQMRRGNPRLKVMRRRLTRQHFSRDGKICRTALDTVKV